MPLIVLNRARLGYSVVAPISIAKCSFVSLVSTTCLHRGMHTTRETCTHDAHQGRSVVRPKTHIPAKAGNHESFFTAPASALPRQWCIPHYCRSLCKTTHARRRSISPPTQPIKVDQMRMNEIIDTPSHLARSPDYNASGHDPDGFHTLYTL